MKFRYQASPVSICLVSLNMRGYMVGNLNLSSNFPSRPPIQFGYHSYYIYIEKAAANLYIQANHNSLIVLRSRACSGASTRSVSGTSLLTVLTYKTDRHKNTLGWKRLFTAGTIKTIGWVSLTDTNSAGYGSTP